MVGNWKGFFFFFGINTFEHRLIVEKLLNGFKLQQYEHVSNLRYL